MAVELKLGIWFPAVRTYSGADTFTEVLATMLESRGHQVRIDWLPSRAEYAPWTVPTPRAPRWASLSHVNSWLHHRFLRPNLPVLTTVHACMHDPVLYPFLHHSQRLYHRHWIHRLERACLNHSNKIVAVSHYTARATCLAFPFIKDIAVIHNGVDIAHFHPPTVRTVHRPFRLLYAGNWSLRKGVDLLPELMRRLGNEFELMYTADRNQAHQHYSLPSNCQCIGRLDRTELPQVFQQADALIFPSRIEGLPLVVLEAMACGLPVIAQDSCLNREIIEDGVNGLLTRPEDIDHLTASCRQLASNSQLLEACSAQARASVEHRFSLERMTNAYLKIYHELVNQRTNDINKSR